MGKVFIGGDNPNKNPGGCVRSAVCESPDAHVGRDHTDLTQLKSLVAIDHADYKGRYGDHYKSKIFETFKNLHHAGILEFIVNGDQLSLDDYKSWSAAIEQNGSMINRTPEELAKAIGLFVVKERGEFRGGAAIFRSDYHTVDNKAVGQRGSFISLVRGLGSFILERINYNYQGIPLYGITKEKNVAIRNGKLGNYVLTVQELQQQYPFFHTRLETTRGHFDYKQDDDGYYGHYVTINEQLFRILQQEKHYHDIHESHVLARSL